MSPNVAAPRAPVAALPRSVLIIIGLAATMVVAIGLHRIAGVVAPTFLALVLTTTAAPIRTRLVARGVPGWVGSLAVITVVTLGVVAFVALLVLSVARLAGLVPQYADRADELTSSLKDWLVSLGVAPEQGTAMLSSLDLGSLARFLGDLLSGLLGSMLSLVFVLAIVLFTCIDAGTFSTALGRLRHERPTVVAAMDGFAHGTRRYLLVASVFGLAVAVIDTLMLWALGVPAPVLWGLLAFVTNYIPNIGFVIGLVPPVILALLEGGPSLALTVIVLYSVVNLVIQSIIQPKLVGDAVGLSATLTFLSLIVWAGILGPIGAVMAIPLTLLAKAFLVDVDPQARWIGRLLGDPIEHGAVEAPSEPTGPAGPIEPTVPEEPAEPTHSGGDGTT